jgi:isocitrate/isopropylmalate dehydrogenase
VRAKIEKRDNKTLAITEIPYGKTTGTAQKQSAFIDSILKAAALLLRHICRGDKAQQLEDAMAKCPLTVKSDGSCATCQEYADAVIELL